MALSPMMSHYLETKKQYNDCILFYRLGDFYEMFFDDAVTASRELELVLTGKDCGLPERAPMCGVPFHAAASYINKLVSRGYKIAVAEQLEDPRYSKGLVKRDVIRVITPGTNTDSDSLDSNKNNYLMCVYYSSDGYSISLADITTGVFLATHVDSAQAFTDEINKFSVAEIISNKTFMMAPVDFAYIRDKLKISCFSVPDSYFAQGDCIDLIKKHFHVLDLSGLGLIDYPLCIPPVGAILRYLYDTQKTNLDFLNKITVYSTAKYMIIDSATRRNLELTETMRDKNKTGSLLWVLDKTRTAMGARMLRSYIEQPLLDSDEIIMRQDALEELNSSPMDRDEIREYLTPVYDLERILARISYHSANPRDIIAFKNSLEMLPHVKNIMAGFHSNLLSELYKNFDCLEDIAGIIEKTVVDDPPVSIKDGGLIKDGASVQVDKYRKSKIEGKKWLAELETSEKEKTGIKTLKVKYNKVFGYYIEVTNSFKDKVPERYMRKQTLVNAERFITDELKELEDTILGAEERLFALEYELFTQLRDKISSETVRIQKAAYIISQVDALASMAYVAEKNRYVRPRINSEGHISIKDGRHPVVELMIGEGKFVSNDAYLDTDDDRVAIITGPNMAGKSTYMRQLALIVLMAATGSFVPASFADICICDRIFTRVGASDDLSSGQSTFMMEMTEVANILRNATSDSLIILDEIGRGTSTYDGLGIAWAVVEYIADKKKCGAKTIFSTHYHELTELEGRIDGVKNFCITVKEQGDDIIFLRKIMRGGADKSYGILVAHLAGVPDQVTKRARIIVNELTDADITTKNNSVSVNEYECECPESEPENSYSSSEHEIINKISDLNINVITPLEALNILYELKDNLN